jgi:hypothetical protein
LDATGITSGDLIYNGTSYAGTIDGSTIYRNLQLNETGNKYQLLSSFDGNNPTTEEHNIYNSIMRWIQNQLSENLDIRIVHKWKQGDLVVPDMYKMCHSVSGGFNSNERELKGMCGRQYENDNRN